MSRVEQFVCDLCHQPKDVNTCIGVRFYSGEGKLRKEPPLQTRTHLCKRCFLTIKVDMDGWKVEDND